MRYFIRIFVYCVCCFYLGVPTCIAEKLHIWTDNEGTIHFGQTLPRDVEKDKIETLSYTKTSEHELREYRLKEQRALKRMLNEFRSEDARREENRRKLRVAKKKDKEEAINEIDNLILKYKSQISLGDETLNERFDRIRLEKHIYKLEMMKFSIQSDVTPPITDPLNKANPNVITEIPKIEVPLIKINPGAINPLTGEYLAPAGSGFVGTRDGTFYAPAGPGGVIDTRTGKFIPVTK